MNILLEKFGPWVRQTLAGETLTISKKEIDDEADRVMIAYHGCIGEWSTKRLQRYFRDQQLLTGDMINALGDGDLRQGLVDIWEHLHRYADAYLQPQTALPTVLLDLERRRNAEVFTPLKKAMKRAKVDAGLIGLLEDSFQFRCLPDGELVAIRKVAYLRTLMPLLKTLTDEPKGNLNLQPRIVQLLCLHNLNSVQFYDWYRDSLLKQVLPEYPLMERLRIFRELLAAHADCKQQQNRCFISGLPGIHRQLREFLSGQVNLWEGVLQMTNQLKGQGFLPVHVESTLSVSQLALLFKVYRDYKVFSISKPKRFFEFIANHFGSKSTDHFHKDTLKNDFYLFPTETDATVIYNLFKEMANYVREEYGVVA